MRSNSTMFPNHSERAPHWFSDIMSPDRACSKCGATIASSGQFIDYHHRNPKDMEFHIPNSYGVRSREEIEREVGKCDLLCRSCHMNLHKGKRNRPTEGLSVTLVRLRKRQGFSQLKLSRMIGISRSYMCDLEYGVVRPSVPMLVKLANALDVPVASLLDESVPTMPSNYKEEIDRIKSLLAEANTILESIT